MWSYPGARGAIWSRKKRSYRASGRGNFGDATHYRVASNEMPVNAVKTLPIILLMCLIGPPVVLSANLPDYQQAQMKEFRWACDRDQTRIQTKLYRADDYYVSVSGTETGATFLSVYYAAERRAQFLAKLTGSPDFVELPREAWQEKIKSEMSPNYFKRIRNLENDCVCLSGCQ